MTNRSADLARRIAAGAGELGLSLGAGQVEALVRLLGLLEKWGRSINLTAIRTADEMITLHVLDSLSVAADVAGPDVLDVGTGAGFPGLPLAVARPGDRFTLLDSSRKKLNFVEHAAGELGLGNVTTVRSRVEDYAPEHGFDTVICRAFADLGTIAAVCSPLVKPGGRIVAMKGRDPADERAALSGRFDVTVRRLRIPQLAQERHAVVLRPRDANSRHDSDRTR